VSVLLSWREGVTAETAGDGQFAVCGPGGRLSLRRVAPAALEALRRLAPPGEEEDRLAELAAADGDGALPRWYYYLEALTRRGLLCRSVHAGGKRLATLVAVSPSFAWAPVADGGGQYGLSRFAYLRREGSEVVLESPLAHARVVLHDGRAAALVAALVVPATAEEVMERAGHGLPRESVAAVLELLRRAGMLEAGEEEGTALQTWEFHDLLFHARSRKGRWDGPSGATYRLLGQVAPPPALKTGEGGETVPLYRPDMERLVREDPPLAAVQEWRRSVRTFDTEKPITARQLGEFLYRVARVTECREVEVPTSRGPVRMDFAARPYPAGGGLHELEFYAAINACDDLRPGLYRYEGMSHQLIRLSERTAAVAELLRDAAESTAIPVEELQVLLVLAARFGRIAWKYESIAYALTLKHVGVVYQTMYLAATAMGLGPCAVGGGDADLFARAAGTDYYAEMSVGEFLLGSVRPVS
jgi:SagB-type dehydrogenase family enzyme